MLVTRQKKKKMSSERTRVGGSRFKELVSRGVQSNRGNRDANVFYNGKHRRAKLFFARGDAPFVRSRVRRTVKKRSQRFRTPA
jgi:hypothetical protein